MLTTAAAQRPEQFHHIAQQLRDTREETRRRAQLTATLTDQGVRIIDRPQDLFGGKIRQLSELRASPDTEPGTELTAQAHAGCPGHAAFLSERSWGPVAERVAAVWVCTDFQSPWARRAVHRAGGEHQREGHRGDDRGAEGRAARGDREQQGLGFGHHRAPRLAAELPRPGRAHPKTPPAGSPRPSPRAVTTCARRWSSTTRSRSSCWA